MMWDIEWALWEHWNGVLHENENMVSSETVHQLYRSVSDAFYKIDVIHFGIGAMRRKASSMEWEKGYINSWDHLINEFDSHGLLCSGPVPSYLGLLCCCSAVSVITCGTGDVLALHALGQLLVILEFNIIMGQHHCHLMMQSNMMEYRL